MTDRIAKSVAAAVLVVCAACGGDGGPSGDPGGTTGPSLAVTTIQVTPTPLSLAVGAKGGLTAVARNSSGTVVNATFTWATATPTVATISASGGQGEVTGVAPGTTIITVRSGSIEGAAVVNVQSNGPGPQQLTLQVVPGTASVTVGASAPFSVVARDASGAVQPTPTITSWTSSASSIGTVGTTGVATGVSAGATQIGATAGTLVAAPATLTVTNPQQAGKCDNIGAITFWQGSVDWKYAHTGVNKNNHRISAEHDVRLTPQLTQTFVTPLAVRWNSLPAGTVSVNDADVDLNVSPQRTTTMRGAGQIAKDDAAGQSLPGMQLDVDLTTCMYRFESAVSQRVTVVQPSGQTDVTVAAVGDIRTAYRPLGNWRQLGLSEFATSSLPAHSTLWIAFSGGGFKDAYLPWGLGNLIFAVSTNPNEAPEGEITPSWNFRPNTP